MTIIKGILENSKTNPSPEIKHYPADKEKKNGLGLIIFPGGGYAALAGHEGKGYADFFAAAGIECFVVTYRLGSQGHRHPAMLEDALSSIYTVRKNAAEYGIETNKIGVIGSSAGGHLASHAVTAFDLYQSSISLRPDFGILSYPVIDMLGEYCHVGSRKNLLGPDATEDDFAKVSTDRLVSPQTPPCFLWHTWEDGGVPVENSILFALALRKNKVPFDLHVYETGGHGLGLNTDHEWGRDCLKWLKRFE